MITVLRRIRSWFSGRINPIRPLREFLALTLCLCFLAGGCASAGGTLSGNYVDDTMAVAETLLATITLPQDDPARQASETESRALISDYMARYRPRAEVNGLSSFTTMQTALNSLAGHYATYTNRPLPEALRSRLQKELKKAEAAVQRGA